MQASSLEIFLISKRHWDLAVGIGTGMEEGRNYAKFSSALKSQSHHRNEEGPNTVYMQRKTSIKIFYKGFML